MGSKIYKPKLRGEKGSKGLAALSILPELLTEAVWTKLLSMRLGSI